MARSIMEGGAYEQKMVLGAMERVLGRPLDVIRLQGGGSKSPVWRQIMADVFGRPVEIMTVADSGILGAAILGATGAGIFPSLEDAVTHMVHVKETIVPNKTNNQIYSDLYDIFVKTFEALRDSNVYDQLELVSKKYWRK